MVQQVGRAQFIPSRNDTVRFAVDAFLFKAPGQVSYKPDGPGEWMLAGICYGQMVFSWLVLVCHWL